jgi:hypothetical protein
MEVNYEAAPKKLSDGRYFVKVSNASGRVMLQLNKVKILTKFDESDDVTLELNQAALEKISDIDSQNIAASKLNSQTWFGKVLADQTLEAAYTKSTQDVSMNATKVRVGSQIVTKTFAHDKSPVDSESLEAGVSCDVIREFSGLWLMKKTFGPVWRIAQVRLLAPPKKLYPDEYLFQDEDADADVDADDDYI